MTNKTDIEKTKDLIFYLKQSDDEEDNKLAKAIENILADRERLIDILSKSDTENIKLQKEIEELKNDGYWKRIYSKTK